MLPGTMGLFRTLERVKHRSLAVQGGNQETPFSVSWLLYLGDQERVLHCWNQDFFSDDEYNIMHIIAKLEIAVWHCPKRKDRYIYTYKKIVCIVRLCRLDSLANYALLL